MGFLEKLKNTFFEEEYVEIEEKPKKVTKEVKKPEVKVVREEKEVAPRVEEVKKEEVVVAPKKEEVTSFPKEEKKMDRFSIFDDDDFLDMEEEGTYQKPVRPPKVDKPSSEKPKPYDNPVYGTKKQAVTASTTTSSSSYAKDAKKMFKPTPIISPIYGILDKNYTKEEIIEKKEIKPSSSYVSRKNADLDSVREKAFGSMMGDFNLLEEPGKVQDNLPEIEEENEDNLLFDMTDVSKTPSVDKVTLQDAEEYFQDLGLEYNVDYKDAKLEKVTGRRVTKTPKLDEIEEEDIPKEEDTVIFPAEEEKKTKTRGSSSLEDNLFDLIDSMYEEKE